MRKLNIKNNAIAQGEHSNHTRIQQGKFKIFEYVRFAKKTVIKLTIHNRTWTARGNSANRVFIRKHTIRDQQTSALSTCHEMKYSISTSHLQQIQTNLINCSNSYNRRLHEGTFFKTNFHEIGNDMQISAYRTEEDKITEIWNKHCPKENQMLKANIFQRIHIINPS